MNIFRVLCRHKKLFMNLSKLIISLIVFQIHYLKISRIYEIIFCFEWFVCKQIIRELVKLCQEQLIDNHHESLEFLIKSEQTIYPQKNSNIPNAAEY